MQEETLSKYAILAISRGYEGIKIEESDLPEEDRQRLFLSYSRGTPTGNYLVVNPLNDEIDIVAYCSGSEKARIGLMQLNSNLIMGSALFSKQLAKLLEKLNMADEFKLEVPSVEKSISYISDFEGLDGILFGLYAGLPLYVLGSHLQNVVAFSHFLNLLPDSISRKISLHSFCQDFCEGINWVGFPPTQKSLDVIAEHVDEALIVSISSKKASSPFSCSFVEEMATKMQSGEISTCKELEDYVRRIFDVANKIDPQNSVEEIASQFEITIDNAEFFLQVRKNYESHESFSNMEICKKR